MYRTKFFGPSVFQIWFFTTHPPPPPTTSKQYHSLAFRKFSHRPVSFGAPDKTHKYRIWFLAYHVFSAYSRNNSFGNFWGFISGIRNFFGLPDSFWDNLLWVLQLLRDYLLWVLPTTSGLFIVGPLSPSNHLLLVPPPQLLGVLFIVCLPTSSGGGGGNIYLDPPTPLAFFIFWVLQLHALTDTLLLSPTKPLQILKGSLQNWELFKCINSSWNFGGLSSELGIFLWHKLFCQFLTFCCCQLL